jgi:ElaB/YqjD/DUF883 family membrane-anchored ribosome-binding protein
MRRQWKAYPTINKWQLLNGWDAQLKQKPREDSFMVDKNTAEMAQNVADTTRESAKRGYSAAQDYANKGYDSAREYANKGYGAAREYANKGYDAAREYANVGVDAAARMSENLSEFVRREPWVAIAAAFAVGYVAARIMRRLSL